MKEPDLLKDAGPAAVICAVLAALYLGFGLMTVVVMAALFDCALRRVEVLRDRRARAHAAADATGSRRM